MSSLCLLGASLVYGAILTFLPIYAQQRNISDYGIFFVVYALATMGSRVFAGKLSDHVDRASGDFAVFTFDCTGGYVFLYYG